MPDSKEKKREKRRLLKESDPVLVKEQQKRANLKHNFGITLEQYNEMLKNQRGLCAICEVHYSNFKRALAVDHCHHTGKIRGPLCASCNSGLGKLQDSVDYLESAIRYLSNGPRYLTEVVLTPNVPEVTR